MNPQLLLDTSILIERERGAALKLSDDATWGISAITIAELNLGVLRARSALDHQRRLTTFLDASSRLVLPFDDTVARTFAEIVAWAESHGRRPPTADAVIAATAATHGATLVTLDQGFEALVGFDGLDITFA